MADYVVLGTWDYPAQCNCSSREAIITGGLISVASNSTLERPVHTILCDPPPFLVISDYVIIGLCLLACLVGTPINALAGSRLRTQHARDPESRLVLLNIHLVVSNFLVIGFACFGKAFWHIFYAWHGGWVMCKLFKFFETLSTYLTSNMTVILALDMLMAFRCPFATGISRARKLVLLAWICATLASLPQLVLFDVVTPFQCHPEWHQCAFIPAEWPNSTIGPQLKFWYGLAHLCVLFWIPLFLLIPAYAAIIFLIVRHSMDQDKLRTPSTRARAATAAATLASVAVAHLNGAAAEAQEVTPAQSSLAARQKWKSPAWRTSPCLMQLRKCMKHTASIIGLYLASWLPYQCFSLVEITDQSLHDSYAEYLEWLYFIYVCHSCVNPMVYTFRMRGVEKPRYRGTSSQLSSRTGVTSLASKGGSEMGTHRNISVHYISAQSDHAIDNFERCGDGGETGVSLSKSNALVRKPTPPPTAKGGLFFANNNVCRSPSLLNLEVFPSASKNDVSSTQLLTKSEFCNVIEDDDSDDNIISNDYLDLLEYPHQFEPSVRGNNNEVFDIVIDQQDLNSAPDERSYLKYLVNKPNNNCQPGFPANELSLVGIYNGSAEISELQVPDKCPDFPTSEDIKFALIPPLSINTSRTEETLLDWID